jgi:hypothetical protein
MDKFVSIPYINRRTLQFSIRARPDATARRRVITMTPTYAGFDVSVSPPRFNCTPGGPSARPSDQQPWYEPGRYLIETHWELGTSGEIAAEGAPKRALLPCKD